MKKQQTYSLAALLTAALAFGGCTADELNAGDEQQGQTTTWTVIGTGTQADDDELTRALSLGGSSGKTLYTNWEDGDQIVALNSAGKGVGTLSISIDGFNASLATITGTVSGEYEVGDELTYYTPSNVRDWTGQNGTIANLSAKYNYQQATVKVKTVDANKKALTMSGAAFSRAEAIVHFTFTDGDGNTLKPEELTISAENGKLVQKIDAEGNVTYGDITVTDASYAANGDYYVALHNDDQTTATKYTFTAKVNGDTYTGPTDRDWSSKLTDNRYVNVARVLTKEDTGDTFEAVDLGLSVKWANMNLGASKITDYGDHYAWGETSTKSDYSWATYKWCNGSETTLTKYNNKSDYGTVDNTTTLEADDDAAHVVLGGNWYIPTADEFQELRDNTTRTWQTDYNGVSGCNGMLFTSTKPGYTDKSIFLPAANRRYGTVPASAGTYGFYWSSSLYESDASRGHYLYIAKGGSNYVNRYQRNYGLIVRAVQRNN